MPVRASRSMAIIFAILLMIPSINCEDDGTNYENVSPNRPSDPTPPDGAADQPVDVQLFWSCSDPDRDTLVYDIFFGETGDPPLVESAYSDTTYNPGQLQYNTTYYWKIVASDSLFSRPGPVWSFTTEAE